jgi:hypothetical protein
MKKVLITGMAAPQTSARLAKRNATFSGAVAKLLQKADIEVDHREPWIAKDATEFDEYDSVIVGVSPVLSLSANNAYGALSVIDSLFYSEKLRLLIDAPDPDKIPASFRAINRVPDNLVKPLYRARKGYGAVLDDTELRARLDWTAARMLTGWTPRTIFPASVGVSNTDVARRIDADPSSVVAINVDAALVKVGGGFLPGGRSPFWCVDTPKSKWFETVKHGLTWNWMPAKEHKGEIDDAIEARLLTCSGVMIAPSDGGLLWWNPRMIQAVNTGTVVATDWRSASWLGESWTCLPSTIEDMSQIDRFEIAMAQRKDFLSSTPKVDDSVEALIKELGF